MISAVDLTFMDSPRQRRQLRMVGTRCCYKSLHYFLTISYGKLQLARLFWSPFKLSLQAEFKQIVIHQ